mmetsp:Transcript_15423/g.31700  ORF Transcript_15423/g.31700 Transcript_15423/m.31700 type:complete len:319 (+) Transcript_15423:70-1026(+)
MHRIALALMMLTMTLRAAKSFSTPRTTFLRRKSLPSTSQLVVVRAGSGGGRKVPWRPTVDDVIRISWGKPAKQKGTGSRGVPHRLNTDERDLFDRGVVKGFIEVPGSGWRKERRDAPLVNTFRSYCDAKGQPFIAVMKEATGVDSVVVDLSPLRAPSEFDSITAAAVESVIECVAEYQAQPLLDNQDHYLEEEAGVQACEEFEGEEEAAADSSEREEENLAGFKEGVADKEDDIQWMSLPIYRLPTRTCGWVLPRQGAKKLAKQLASHFETSSIQGTNTAQSKDKRKTRAPLPGGSREKGMPKITPGKSRRSGGYGIG